MARCRGTIIGYIDSAVFSTTECGAGNLEFHIGRPSDFYITSLYFSMRTVIMILKGRYRP